MNLNRKKSMTIIAIVLIVLAVVVMYNFFFYKSPSNTSRDIWSGSCGTPGQNLVVRYRYTSNLHTTGYGLYLLLRDNSEEIELDILEDRKYFPFQADDFTLYSYREKYNNIIIHLNEDTSKYYPLKKQFLGKGELIIKGAII